MIFTACVNCDHSFAVPLADGYLDALTAGRVLATRHVCESCGTVNYVEHVTVGGETFGESDPRAALLAEEASP